MRQTDGENFRCQLFQRIFASADTPREPSGTYNSIVRDDQFAGWTTEQIATARRWVVTWKQAGPRLEQLRREELRRLDPQQTLALLCGEADYTVPPRAPQPTSGLVEQQRWFIKLVKAASRRE